MRRKPDPEQRRLELCDAAITLLAEDGIKGLSHRKVDRAAGVPDGTTSFNFRTLAALVHAVAARVAALDLEELTIATAASPAAGDGETSGVSGLARLIMRSSTGPPLIRSRARLELVLQSHRDVTLAEAFRHSGELFLALHRDVVLRLQPSGAEIEPAHIDEQAYVLQTFIGGLMTAIAHGDNTIESAEQLDGIMSAIVSGLSARR
ncbi:TetR family transcriptional regulator C-terminal domain-containing protein [Mycolicibacterium sediminis]|uniref:TetR family transcriptional regulator n=1 Tax=Mycolicibacterium sediminis TaxID=1286180 RepID=A0A7I7QLH9_9MYCO|nr:TetR family transcriptional regulator [Mycolicibacterium sediminis]